MISVLLLDATEDLQPLADALERAGYRVTTSPLADAARRLQDGELMQVIVVNLLEAADAGQAKEFLRTDVKQRPPAIAVVRREQLDQLDPGLEFADLLVFPASSEELLARVRRAVRPAAGSEEANVLHRGDLTIDHSSYKVFVGSRPVELTYKEYELLRYLAMNEGKVCTRETLLNRVWGYDFYGGARTVDVHIRRLRSKIEDRHHTLIETVRNVGYRFSAA